MDSLHEPAQRWEMSLPHISVMGTGEPLSPWDLYGWKKKNSGSKVALSGLIKDKLELVSSCASGDSARAQGEQIRNIRILQEHEGMKISLATAQMKRSSGLEVRFGDQS